MRSKFKELDKFCLIFLLLMFLMSFSISFAEADQSSIQLNSSNISLSSEVIPENHDLSEEVQTKEIENFSAGKATLEGEVTSLKDLEELIVFFEYRIENEDEWRRTKEENISSPDNFSKKLVDLNYDETYEYRLVGESNSLRFTGETEKFSTEDWGEFEIIGIENLRTNSGVVLGEIENLNLDNIETFFKIKSEDSSWKETEIQFVESQQIVEDSIDLEPGKRYTVRMIVNTPRNGYRSENYGFQTPSFKTHPAENISTHSVNLIGELECIGSKENANVGFRYRSTENDTWNENYLDEKDNHGIFVRELENLHPNTSYNYQTVVDWNSQEYGDKENFKTRTYAAMENLRILDVSSSSSKIGVSLEELEADNISIRFELRRSDGTLVKVTDRLIMKSTGEIEKMVEDLDWNTEYIVQISSFGVHTVEKDEEVTFSTGVPMMWVGMGVFLVIILFFGVSYFYSRKKMRKRLYNKYKGLLKEFLESDWKYAKAESNQSLEKLYSYFRKAKDRTSVSDKIDVLIQDDDVYLKKES